MKKLLFVLILAGAAAGGFYVYKQKHAGPEGVVVQTAPVERQKIVQTVTATGRIQPTTQVNISADVSAKITKLPVKEGQWVDKGDLLVEIERERYLASVEVSEANVRAAESNSLLAKENMIKADKDYQRAKGLFDGKLESQAALDSSYAASQAEKARYQSSIDQAEQAKASLKQIRDDLSKTTIYAPLSGTISQLNKEVGEIALGSQFTEDVIMVISNLDGMEALVDVDENDIVSVAVGDASTIEVDALPGVVLHGTVTDIANTAKMSAQGTTNQKTEFEVKIAVTDVNSALRPGMTASSEVTVDVKEDVPSAPIQSVAVRTIEQLKAEADQGDDADALPVPTYVPDKDGFVEIVFVVKDGRSEARQVKTGIQSDTQIEIVEGLELGEEIVVGNYRAISKDLHHGAKVVVKNEPKKTAEAVVALSN